MRIFKILIREGAPVLTHTAETAIRAMIHLARQPGSDPVPIRRVGVAVGGSGTYVAKTVQRLVAAGLLRSTRGAWGGVALAAPADRITLRAIVEAAQGVFGEDYCLGAPSGSHPCGFHRAMVEAREAMLGALSRWSLRELAAPGPDHPICKMSFAPPTAAPAPVGREDGRP